MKREIKLTGRKFEFSLPLGKGPAVVVGGGARFEEVPRPEDTSLTVYEGNDPIRLDVPVFLDGWPHHGRGEESVNPDLQRVLDICVGSNGNRPPWFRATGPIPFSGRRFVMAGLPEWGAEQRSERSHRALVRQEITLHLLEFEDPDTIRFRRRRRRGRGNGGTSAPPSSVKAKGRTLVQIAAAYFGDPSRAKEIGKMNGIRDVRKKLPANRRIKLPVA